MTSKLKEISKGQRCLLLAMIVIAIISILAIWVSVSLSRDIEGIYLLKGTKGRLIEIADTLYLGEEGRLIAGIDFFSPEPEQGGGRVVPEKRLDLVWNDATGHGYLRNQLGDGTALVTNFSLYRDSEEQVTHGLFIGGALPAALRSDRPDHQNNSGMTWFDGKGWNHIWCNTNEGIGSTLSPRRYAPSDWTYLGSRIVEQNERQIVVLSSHEVRVDNVPLRIDRTIEALAGEPYLKLRMQITNIGSTPGHYFYYYGDEPWLGDFGGSQGDIGWTRDQLVKYESVIDPKTQSFAGMVDFGNDVIGEGHNFRRVANFIEWSGPDRPDVVFFANRYEGFAHDPQVQVPLQGDGRSLGMYWGPRTLPPGQSQTIDLTIGMASVDPATGMPRKPDIPHRLVAAL